jgi:hypothetical protein
MNAAETYHQNKLELETELTTLKHKLRLHNTKFHRTGGKSYVAAGDLGYLLELLKQANEFLK